MRALILAAALACAPLHAAPLPETDSWHFFALTDGCGNAQAFVWFSPSTGIVMPVSEIRSEQALDRVLAARDKAAEAGNAYVVRGEAGDCQRV